MPNTLKALLAQKSRTRSSPAPRYAVSSLNAGCVVKRRRARWRTDEQELRTPPSWCVKLRPAWI